MTKPYHPIAFPRPVLAALFTVTAVSLGAAGAGRMYPASSAPTGSVLASRELRSEHGADGSVIMRMPCHDAPLQVLTGEQGFLRGTVRGLVCTSEAGGLGPEVPFRLAAWADGRLTLEGPVPDCKLDLLWSGTGSARPRGRHSRVLTFSGGVHGL